MLLELDVDGVIANIHGDLNNKVYEKFGKHFDGDKDISSWGMKELDPEVRSYILSLFNSPDYIGNLHRIDGTLEALAMIDVKLRELGWYLVFNTNVCKGCKDVRTVWLDDLIKETGVRATSIVSEKAEKFMLKSTIVVDDYVVNLNNSNAQIKVLLRRGHNRDIKLEDIKKSNRDGSKVYIIKHLFDLVNILEEF